MLTGRASGGRAEPGMGAPRHLPPGVASGVESEEPRPALWGFMFPSECDDFPVLGFLEKKYTRNHIFVVTNVLHYFRTSLLCVDDFLSYRGSFLSAVV